MSCNYEKERSVYCYDANGQANMKHEKLAIFMGLEGINNELTDLLDPEFCLYQQPHHT